mgnify:CR=1 FL=1
MDAGPTGEGRSDPGRSGACLQKKGSWMESIRQQISEFVATTFPMPAGGEQDHHGRSLLESGAIDSIGVLTLVTWLEEQFGIVVDDEDVVPENLDNIDSLVSFVRGKLGGTDPAG